MGKLFKKLGRKGTKRFYCIGSVLLLVLFITFSVVYVYTYWNWLFWAGIDIIIIWPIITFIYITTEWSWHIEDLMSEYKKNNNVLSGGLAILALFAFPFIISLVFSQMEEYVAIKELFKGLSSLIIAAMPAFIGLLGVQYSVAIQERNRKEDLRLGAKPFFSVSCDMVGEILDGYEHHDHKIHIMVNMKNISKNIGIPRKIVFLDEENSESNFKYLPIAPTEEFCEQLVISSIDPHKVNTKLEIYYADVYNNTYKMQIEFLLQSDESLSDIHIVSDDVVKE